MSSLPCGLSSSCSEQGPLSRYGVQASHVVAHGPWGAQASVVVAHGLSCSLVCGIFQNQGSNQCLLHWQADSYPLDHQGSPRLHLLKERISRNLGNYLKTTLRFFPVSQKTYLVLPSTLTFHDLPSIEELYYSRQ